MSDSNRTLEDRIFSLPDPTCGLIQWYCMTREGIMGPFESKQFAELALTQFVQLCEALGVDGGRNEETTFEERYAKECVPPRNHRRATTTKH